MHFGTHYIPWRESRFKTIVAHYPEGFFEGKTLLELGAGHGDLGAMFAKIGAKVTCAEGRPEHATAGQNRYAGLGMEFKVVDLENQWPFEEFDIILNLGLIYHFKVPDFSIIQTCKGAKYSVIEGEICDGASSTALVQVKEQGFDQALNGWGCRPTASYVENLFRECGVKYEMLKSDSANAGLHHYDWVEQSAENEGYFECGQRRMWFIERE
jgi:hypothetical protein